MDDDTNILVDIAMIIAVVALAMGGGTLLGYVWQTAANIMVGLS